MFDKDLFLDLFIAPFALLNPLFAISVFLGLTSDSVLENGNGQPQSSRRPHSSR